MGIAFNFQAGQTALDEDEKEGLMIKSISTQEELDEFEQLNIEKAVEWTILNKFKPEKILTEKFIKDLHKKMYGDVWKWAGDFRKSNKNIGIDWTGISTSLKNLIDDVKYWIENDTFSAVEIAIRLKHRIVSIHCFPNGNGRHSRLLADIVIESVFKQEIFSWYKSNMVNADETRKKYIKILRAADNGDIQPLIDFART